MNQHTSNINDTTTTQKNTLVFDIGGTSIKSGYFDINGDLTTLPEVDTDAKRGGEAVLNTVLTLAKAYLKDHDNCSCIGISTCGQVDNRDGSILFATDNVPGYTGIQLKQRIQDTFNLPVAVENDVNAAALGEAHFGAASGYDNFICLTYGTGIGGAIYLNGSLYTGRYGSAGELGHMITHAGGNLCTCGSRGCYETYASTGALVRLVKQELSDNCPADINGKTIFQMLESGNPDIERCVNQWIDEIAVGLAGIMHIFEPQAILLGGGIMQEAYLSKEIRIRVSKMVMKSYKDIPMIAAVLGNKAGLYGAYFASTQL